MTYKRFYEAERIELAKTESPEPNNNQPLGSSMPVKSKYYVLYATSSCKIIHQRVAIGSMIG